MRTIRQRKRQPVSYSNSSMSIAKKQEILDDFKKTFHEKVKGLSTAVTIINCVNDSDEKLMKTAIRMLNSFDEELQSCGSAVEMNELVDVEQLYARWNDIHDTLNKTSNPGAIANIFKQVSESKIEGNL